MFVHAVPDNKGNKDGYYCTLVESKRENGKSKHHIVLKFGFVPSQRLPYLKAAFNAGDPETILRESIRKLEDKKNG